MSVLVLHSCAVTPPSEPPAALEPLELKPFVADNYIVSKVAKFDGDRRLLLTESSRIDTDSNEIFYYQENREDGTFRRFRLKYDEKGLLRYRHQIDRDGNVIEADVYQHNSDSSVRSSTHSVQNSETSQVLVENYLYDGGRLIGRRITDASNNTQIEAYDYNRLPTGHLDQRKLTRKESGETSSDSLQYEYDQLGRITKRIYGTAGDNDFLVFRFELYSYDSNNNLSVVIEKDASDNTLSRTNYEYYDAQEPSYNRNQFFLAYLM